MNWLLHFRAYLLQQDDKPSLNTIKSYLADINQFLKWFETTYKIPFTPESFGYSQFEDFKRFLQNYKYSPLTSERRISSLRKFFLFLIARGSIASITDITGPTVGQKGKTPDPYQLREFKAYLYTQNREPNTIKNYSADLVAFFNWLEKVYPDFDLSAQTKFARININTIAEYQKRLAHDANFSRSSINRHLSSLRQYCQWATTQRLLTNNPFKENISEESTSNIAIQSRLPRSSEMADTLAITDTTGDQRPRTYSRFPPLRLVQKILRALDYLLVRLIIRPLTNVIGQPKETSVNKPGRYVKNFYAPITRSFITFPYSIGTKTLFLILGLGFLISIFGGFYMYDQFIKPKPRPSAEDIARKEEKEQKVFEFTGRLTDRNGNAINTSKLVIFSFYPHPTSFETLLHQEVHEVSPDSQGFFTATLTDVPQSITTSQTPVYLGIAVRGDTEMQPRTLVAGYEQGVTALLNEEGKLIIETDSPSFIAQSGTFSITGQQLLMQTSDDSDGSIILWPQGDGKVDILGTITNSINGIVQFGDALSVNSGAVDEAFTVQSGGSTIFSITASGTITAQNGEFGGNITPALSGIYNLGSPTLYWKTIYAQNIIGPATGIQGYWQRNSGALSPSNITDDLLIGNIATSSAKFRVNAENGSISSSGDIAFNGGINSNNTIALTPGAGKNFNINLSTTGDFNVNSGQLYADTSARNIGVGTSSPGARLQVDGEMVIGYGGVSTAGPSNGMAVFGNVGIGITSPGSSLHIIGGVQVGTPTGGDKGVGSINISGDIYKNNTAYTNPDYALEQWATGEIVLNRDKPGASSYIGVMSLEETEAYARANFQLPRVASASGLFERADIILEKAEEAYIHLFTLNDKIAASNAAIASLENAVANLQAGIIKAQEITINSLVISTDTITIAGQSLKDYITSIVRNEIHRLASQGETLEVTLDTSIISPIAEADRVKTNILSPLASDTIIVDGKLTIGQKPTVSPNEISHANEVFPDSHVNDDIVLEVFGNASVSGSLSAYSLSSQQLDISSLQSNEATISGTLHAKELVSDTISNLENRIANLTASSSAQLNLDRLIANAGSFLEGFLVLGPSGFSDVSLTGMLTLGSQFILSDNSLNVLGSDLKLQNLGQGGVSIADGKVYIDSMGNISATSLTTDSLSTKIISPLPDEDLVIRLGPDGTSDSTPSFIIQDASASSVLTITDVGDLIASGSGQFKDVKAEKLTLPEIINKVAADGYRLQTNGTVGKGTIISGSYEITIETPFVTENSLIYITPTSETGGFVPYVARQVPGKSFTVAIYDWLEVDITFNWWIIN